MSTTNDTKFKCYSSLILLPTFEERFYYLKLDGFVGSETFGSARYINQDFYRGKIWRDFRHHIIVRDNGCDLAHKDHPFTNSKSDVVHIHHINPLTLEELMDDFLHALDEENVILTSSETHRAIHYGSSDYLKTFEFATRTPNDTCPWKNKTKRMETI